MKTTNIAVDDLTAEAQDLGMYTDPGGLKAAMDSGSYRTWLQGLDETDLEFEFVWVFKGDAIIVMFSILSGNGSITRAHLIDALVEMFERKYHV